MNDTAAKDAWIDRDGDVWTLGADGLMHTPETRPFPREHVEKKWGPLRAPCPDCDHFHTPDGCTGPPTPSDLWAGVSVEGCDCDYDYVTPPGEGNGR